MKPKILFIDIFYDNFGSKRLNSNIINSLSEFSDVYVLCTKGWYDELKIKPKQIFEYMYPEKSIKNNKRILEYSLSLYNLKLAAKYQKKFHFDYLLFASYETIGMCFAKAFFHDDLSKIFILENDNVDRINKRRFKRKCYDKYKNKVHHITLSPFISEALIKKFGVRENLVFSIPHPLNNMSKEDNIPETQTEFDCVGISNSNSEELIEQCINAEMQTNFFKDNGLHCVLRSKKQTFDDKYLQVIKGYLEDKDYYHYINSAKSILILFPSTFQYRMSGSMIDAFSNRKIILGTKIPAIEYYSKSYSEICLCFDDFEDFKRKLLFLKRIDSEKADQEFDTFINEHSGKNLTYTLQQMFK